MRARAVRAVAASVTGVSASVRTTYRRVKYKACLRLLGWALLGWAL